MIKEQIHNLYLEFFNKEDSEITYQDAAIENKVLYDLLNTAYFSPDYPEVFLMYNEEKDYIFLKRNSKFINGKSGNNLILEELWDCAGMNYEKGFKKVQDDSQIVLSEDELSNIKKLKKAMKNAIEFEIQLESMTDSSLERLFNISKKDLNNSDKLVNVKRLLKENYNNLTNENSIKKIIQKSEDFACFVKKNLGYSEKLDIPAEETEVKYKVFYVDSEEKHFAYNKWISEKNPVQLNNSIWRQYGEKGLFYLTPIDPKNGFSKKYMIVAHNDLEIVGVTQLNDLSSAMNMVENISDAFKMPYIGIQEKFRGRGIATDLFKIVIDIVEKEEKFLIRTAPSKMGGRYTQAKFTEMCKALKKGIAVNSEEVLLYENFVEQTRDANLPFSTKRQMYAILKEEMYNKLKNDKNFYFCDASEMLSDKKVISRINEEVFKKGQGNVNKVRATL